MTLLVCENLTVGTRGGREIVRGVNLALEEGKVAALIGESGSGKTLLGRAIMDLLPAGLVRAADRLELEGDSLLGLGAEQTRSLRGRRLGMIFQEPLTCLNPAMRVGQQMVEALRLHRGCGAAEGAKRASEALGRVRIPDAEACLQRFPHELSGGMRQRVMLASAILLEPALLIADEPTTALDVLVGADVLALMTSIARDMKTAVLLITHDLQTVAQHADQVHVMERGSIVESGDTSSVFARPSAAYTKDLLAALPIRGVRNPTGGEPLVEMRGLTASYPGRSGLGLFRRAPATPVLRDINLTISKGEILAVVGESGSGKTTLGKVMCGLRKADQGSVTRLGPDSSPLTIQYVFQDPFSSLDPRMRVCDSVGEGLPPGRSRHDRVVGALNRVGLGEAYLDRLPHQLSGGQRQRVGIARALVMEPDVVIADEAVSALDLTVKKKVLDLLTTLQKETGFTCVFITHDMAVVEQVADRVAVIRQGQIVELGSVADVLDSPQHPYTRELVAAISRVIPLQGGGVQFERRRVDPADGANGRSVRTEGSLAADLCEVAPGHFVLSDGKTGDGHGALASDV